MALTGKGKQYQAENGYGLAERSAKIPVLPEVYGSAVSFQWCKLWLINSPS
jgi:hypothetical protein